MAMRILSAAGYNALVMAMCQFVMASGRLNHAQNSVAGIAMTKTMDIVLEMIGNTISVTPPHGLPCCVPHVH